jgi:hypothetical protein
VPGNAAVMALVSNGQADGGARNCGLAIAAD